MRRILVALVATSTLLLGATVPARAEPPGPGVGALPPGWSVDSGALTWTSERAIPPGDSAVEFWAGDRLLGRADGTADPHTFVLRKSNPGELTDLQVKVGGRRVDAAAPKAARKKAQPVPSAAAALPANAVDPGVKGPYKTKSGEYTLPGVKLSDYPVPVEMRAVVVAPTNAPGPRPLALFLHGRHWTCYSGADLNTISLAWPCPAGSTSVDSYRGYLQAQELLASQGYVTVSISANGVSAYDNGDADLGGEARSVLVRTHLAHWADWAGKGRKNAPAIVRAVPRADLGKVFLIGHSRGGDGVSRAALDSLTPPPNTPKARWTIRGLLLIGPTAFGQNPQPDVPSATILPGCDGDVSDLQGQMYVDASRGIGSGRALHSALYVVGANHNYFNTEWTPGQAAGPAIDDFWEGDEPDPVCTPGFSPLRLTAAQEQTVGATYIAAAARLFVGGDDRVRPLLDGSGVRAKSAGPARVLSHAIGANRSAVVIPGTAVGVRNGRVCEQVVVEDPCLEGTSPHFVSFAVPEPGRYAIAVNGTATAAITPAKAMPVSGSKALALRLIVPPNSAAKKFAVAVTDDRGRRFDLGKATVTGLPGTDMTSSYWAQEVRLPLPRGIRAIKRLDITPASGGPAWLIDAWGWRAGTPAPRPAALDRVDVGDLTVNEGGAGTRTYSVPVNAYGKVSAKVRLFLIDPDTYEAKSWVAVVKPGRTKITVPISVTGNTTYGGDRHYPLAAKAIGNTVVGDYVGGLDVREDDPLPTFTFDPATATEGSPLTWTVHLSAPADGYLYLELLSKAPATGPELSSTDVDPDWFAMMTGEDPLPSRPLSSTGIGLFAEVEPGKTTVQVEIPTVADGVPEGAEHVSFQARVYPPDFSDPIPVGTADGTLTD